jgi:Fe2+ transport system protein FeoA
MQLNYKIIMKDGGTKMTNRRALKELKPGDKGRVAKITGGGFIFRRILDMGIVKGAEVEVERVAPFGDPIEVKVKGYHLSLRKKETENILVEDI